MSLGASSSTSAGVDGDEDLQFHVIQTKVAVDPAAEKVYCSICKAAMKYLPGFPEGHRQWICESCGCIAYQGLGDTPSHDSDFNTLASPNNPYADDDTIDRVIVKDIPDPDLDAEPERQLYGRVDITNRDKRRRHGMRYAFQTAEEATRKI